MCSFDVVVSLFFFLHTSDAIADVKEVQVSLRQLELQMITFDNTKNAATAENNSLPEFVWHAQACVNKREHEHKTDQGG